MIGWLFSWLLFCSCLVWCFVSWCVGYLFWFGVLDLVLYCGVKLLFGDWLWDCVVFCSCCFVCVLIVLWLYGFVCCIVRLLVVYSMLCVWFGCCFVCVSELVTLLVGLLVLDLRVCCFLRYGWHLVALFLFVYCIDWLLFWYFAVCFTCFMVELGCLLFYFAAFVVWCFVSFCCVGVGCDFVCWL